MLGRKKNHHTSRGGLSSRNMRVLKQAKNKNKNILSSQINAPNRLISNILHFQRIQMLHRSNTHEHISSNNNKTYHSVCEKDRNEHEEQYWGR